jgi:hypothetical protein
MSRTLQTKGLYTLQCLPNKSLNKYRVRTYMLNVVRPQGRTHEIVLNVLVAFLPVSECHMWITRGTSACVRCR